MFNYDIVIKNNTNYFFGTKSHYYIYKHKYNGDFYNTYFYFIYFYFSKITFYSGILFYVTTFRFFELLENTVAIILYFESVIFCD